MGDVVHKDNILAFPYGEQSVDAILAMAKQNGYADVVIIGREAGGGYAVQSSMGELNQIYWATIKGLRIIERCSET